MQDYFDDKLVREWQQDPHNCEAGRKDARDALDRGLLGFKIGVDYGDHAFVELLLQHDVDVELCGDVVTSRTIGGCPGMRPYAYMVAYNHEMVREIDRRFGRGTVLSWRKEADDLERQRRRHK